MVFDSLKNAELYYSLNDKFKIAFDFLKNYKDGDYALGKHEICGSDVFAVVQEYTIQPEKEGIFEGHKNYIDIQYIVSGIEKIGVVELSKAKLEKEYDESIDAAFYSGNGKSYDLLCEAGDYAILFPHDIHRPGMPALDTATNIKKIVVKVKV